MAFRLDPGVPFPEDLGRVVGEQLDVIRAGLRDHDVHATRKAVKRLRAVIRLVAQDLGPKRTRRLDRELRSIARPLAGLRDAQVLVSTFDHVAASIEAPSDDIESARARLREAAASAAIEDTDAAERHLTRFEERLPRHMGPARFDPAGLRSVYRSTRRAMRAAEHEPSGENLHAWRKDVKYHWHHCELLGADDRAETIHAIADALGDDHDLVVLMATLPDLPGLASAVAALQEPLREKAFDLGEAMFSPPPRVAADRLVADSPDS